MSKEKQGEFDENKFKKLSSALKSNLVRRKNTKKTDDKDKVKIDDQSNS